VKRSKPLERLCSWDGKCEHLAEESSSDDALAIFLPSGGSGGKIKHASCGKYFRQPSSYSEASCLCRDHFIMDMRITATPAVRILHVELQNSVLYAPRAIWHIQTVLCDSNPYPHPFIESDHSLITHPGICTTCLGCHCQSHCRGQHMIQLI